MEAIAAEAHTVAEHDIRRRGSHWSDAEHDIIMHEVRSMPHGCVGTTAKRIAPQLPGRSLLSIRRRLYKQLQTQRDDIKPCLRWTEAEDEAIISSLVSLAKSAPKDAAECLAAQLPGRTPQAVGARWRELRKRLLGGRPA